MRKDLSPLPGRTDFILFKSHGGARVACLPWAKCFGPCRGPDPPSRFDGGGDGDGGGFEGAVDFGDVGVVAGFDGEEDADEFHHGGQGEWIIGRVTVICGPRCGKDASITRMVGSSRLGVSGWRGRLIFTMRMFCL